MRRVRREEVQRETFVKPDGFQLCLDCWRLYMLGDDRDLSASRMRFVGDVDIESAAVGGFESDPWEEQRVADIRVGEAVNAEIESMKMVWQWAIRRKCGVATIWLFDKVDFFEALAAAEADLEKRLRVNIVTAMKF